MYKSILIYSFRWEALSSNFLVSSWPHNFGHFFVSRLMSGGSHDRSRWLKSIWIMPERAQIYIGVADIWSRNRHHMWSCNRGWHIGGSDWGSGCDISCSGGCYVSSSGGYHIWRTSCVCLSGGSCGSLHWHCTNCWRI